MKKTGVLMTAAAIAAACLMSCSGQASKIITVTNGSESDRICETVEIDMSSLDGIATAENVVILDADGNQVPSQVYENSLSEVKLLFQATVPAGASVQYKAVASEREAYDTLAYSRYVPERLDDYAYENNLVAGRIYGPALSDPRTFGSDIWLKSTQRLIINEWYEKDDYHHNYGEGMDCYKVANTLGGGAVVPVDAKGKLVIGDNYRTYKHICDGPVRTEAVFEYGPFSVDGMDVSARRVLSLDANSRFVKSVTEFICDADTLTLALGAIRHDVVAYANGDNWIAFTEKASDSSDPDRDGNISVGLVYDAAELADNPLHAAGEIDGHAAIVTREKTGIPVAVWTGSGWSQGGVDSPEAWEATVRAFAYAQAHPLTVTVE